MPGPIGKDGSRNAMQRIALNLAFIWIWGAALTSARRCLRRNFHIWVWTLARSSFMAGVILTISRIFAGCKFSMLNLKAKYTEVMVRFGALRPARDRTVTGPLRRDCWTPAR